MEHRRKLIETDWPLNDISRQSVKEKALTHGHPQTLHRWWARRPLAACRAALFASIVDDPGDCYDEFPDEEAVSRKRRSLNDLITQLVQWKRTDDKSPSNRELMGKVRYEIARSIARNHGDTLPETTEEAETYLTENRNLATVYDPFCGGGSVPHEAQRLGLDAIASDQNPVAVLITKALVQFSHPYVNRHPINSEANKLEARDGRRRPKRPVTWRGASGLADDLRFYGKWILNKARERIGHFYPDVDIPGGSTATTTAWIWANTITCSNVACRATIPLLKSYQLTAKGEKHWVKPSVSPLEGTVEFSVQRTKVGVPEQPTMRGDSVVCLACDQPSPLDYVREEARSKRLGTQMMAIVSHSGPNRHFAAPTENHIDKAMSARPDFGFVPSGSLPSEALGFSIQNYGFTQWRDLYTNRQLLTITTLSMLIDEVVEIIVRDGGEQAYAETIKTYLALALGRTAETNCRFTRWVNTGDKVAGVFGRQTLNMVWDFAEPNIFSNRTQCWTNQVNWVAKVLERLPKDTVPGNVYLGDASSPSQAISDAIVITDPPYYDNIGYADLSDFFYVWLRPLLKDIHPKLFTGISVPKHNQIVAAPLFDDPRQHFADRLSQALVRIHDSSAREYPSSIFYAYRQKENGNADSSLTGWHAMLDSLVKAGFKVVGTWPIRTEHSGRLRSQKSNALATSVLLVCRRRHEDAPITTRGNFIAELEAELPQALDRLTRYNHIEPLDLEQAAIGPGMEVYSKYRSVETNKGEPVDVIEALQCINRVIADYIDREEGELVGDLDAPTQFCLSWVKQHGFQQGESGQAEMLAKPKGVTIDGLRDELRLLDARAGRMRIIDYNEYEPEVRIKRVSLESSIWEGCMLMAHNFGAVKGKRVHGAAQVYSRMGTNAEKVERLARILFDRFERRSESVHSRVFNDIVASWQDIVRNAGADQPELR